MKSLAILSLLLLTGCSYFEGQPERIFYEYEETTSMCAKVLEYPDRIVILYVDCQKAPDTIKRVKHFGEGVADAQDDD